MQTSIAIDVQAPASLVFELARHVDRWATLLPHYHRSRVIERGPDGSLVVEFVARRPLVGVIGLGVPVAWRSRTWNEPESRRLRFRHVGGVTRGMDVTWRIEPNTDGCRVTIDHDFAPRLPGLAWFVDRWFTRAIAGRTLRTFKALAETLDEARSQAPAEALAESDPRPATNHPA